MSATEDVPISPEEDMVREMQALELALLRGGIEERAAERRQCMRCERTPLIGERVYLYQGGSVVCELCRSFESISPMASELVHGPAFGHTIRIIDQRAA